MPSEESVVTGSLWHILKTAGWKINTPRHMFPEDVPELEEKLQASPGKPQ